MHTYESITTLDMLHMLDVLGIPKKTGSTADGHRLIGQGTWWTTCRRPRQRRTLWIWEAAQDGSPCWWRGGNSKVQHDVLQEWNDNDCETYHSCTIYIYVYKYTLYICLCMWYHYHWYKICIFLPGMINSNAWDVLLSHRLCLKMGHTGQPLTTWQYMAISVGKMNEHEGF